MKALIKKIAIILFLGFLCLSAFYVRYNVARRTVVVSFDESVYFDMAQRVAKNWRDYSSRWYAQEFITKYPEVKLPEYLFRPLYKYPPLFTFFNAAALRLSIPVEFVPIGFSVLTIIVTYLLGTLIFNRTAGLLGAFFLYIDPVSIITSQKLWPDTCMTFFMVLAIYLFVCGIRYDKPVFFIFGGISTGLAASVKYPGLLPVLSLALYGFMYERKLSQNIHYRLGLSLPLMILLPWFFWNYGISGWTFATEHMRMHGFNNSQDLVPKLIPYGLMVLLVGIFALVFQKIKRIYERVILKKPSAQTIKILAFAVILGAVVKDHLFEIFSFYHVPNYALKNVIPLSGDWRFYIQKFFEYSLFYGLGLFCLVHDTANKDISFLKIYTLAAIIFFTIWGNFQMRYILPVVPCMILWGIHIWQELMDFFDRQPNPYIKMCGRWMMIALCFFAIAKTAHIDNDVAFRSVMFYY